ncbi:hypothetical protein CRYPD_131 [uncultured Candidatus Thioglobus sp.]|nr:hypothetical protein CRYPD_131 [uncultured Candidatus Thioglobus sp.]
MGNRKITFVNDEYYHIYNRGVDKRVIFNNQEQLMYFFKGLSLLNDVESKSGPLSRFNLDRKADEQLVNVVAYCLLPNHFHLLLKQNIDNGIVKFMQRLGTSYTMFFNKMEERSGSLFQGRFKANHLSGDYALLNVASYVNLNYKHHGIDPKKTLVKSSIFEYLEKEVGECICNTDEINEIIDQAQGLEGYKVYAKQASIAFADNKNILLAESDFEF